MGSDGYCIVLTSICVPSQTERGYSEGKDTGEVNKKGKIRARNKEASYKKQKEVTNKGNTHTCINNLYSA